MSQFAAGRQIRQEELKRRQLVANQPLEPTDAILVVAVNVETQAQAVVGVAVSRRGAAELIALEASKHVGCKFSEFPTKLLLR